MARLLEADVSSTWSESSGGGGPRQHLIEVTFPSAPVAVDFISFHNFYTAAITISHTAVRTEADPLQPMHQKGRPPSWQVVVNRLTLMVDPHCEDDAQQYHELTHTRHFVKEFDHRRVTRLRICCIQPSPSWREYGLKQLRFYTLELMHAPSLQSPPALSDAQRELASTVHEQLVGLGRVAGELRHTIASVAHPSWHNEPQPPRLSATHGSCSRRAEHSRGTSLAPYLVGEWSDELRVTHVDMPPMASASASCATGVSRPGLQASGRF